MSYRIRNAILDLTNAMTTLRHQNVADKATIALIPDEGLSENQRWKATLRLRIETTETAYGQLEAAKAELDAELKDQR